MDLMTSIAQLQGGSPQFRIKEVQSADAPTYFLYGQAELEADIAGIATSPEGKRLVRTNDDVLTLRTGDLVFSLISGQAAIVGSLHNGYLFTQNCVRIKPLSSIDARYLAFLLNEDDSIRHQLFIGQQGSVTLKFTIKQLSELHFSNLPPLEKQELIGELYFNQLRLDALNRRKSTLETALVMGKIKEAH